MDRTFCVNCMKPIDTSIGNGEICPSCGFNNNTPELHGSLPYRTYLQARYMVGRVKSANSEGMTYSALDTQEGTRVDIREYFPPTLAYRDGTSVGAASGKSDSFTKYLQEFAYLARDIMKLRDVRGIIPITEVFHENGTLYVVHEHYDSVSLRSYINKNGVLPWNAAKEMFLPLTAALSSIHAAGVKHLGISPDTIRVCRDGRLRLSEFSIESVRRMGLELEADLLQGCAAYEQYSKNLECDEITDVYGFTASLVFALTGELPDDARKRVGDPKLMMSREVLHVLPPNVVSAIANGLQVRQENRTGSFERLRAELTEAPKVKSEIEETNAIKELPGTNQYTPQTRGGLPPKFWLVGSFLVTALVLVGVIYYLLNYTDFNVNDITSALESQNATSALEVIQVPDLTKQSYNDWVQEIKGSTVYKFTLKVSSQEFNDEIQEGFIISQDPKAGETLKKNGEISVVVSRGKTKRVLPKINGTKFTDALEKLEAEGFDVVKEETYSKDALAGVVLWYVDYNSGDELDYGTQVKVLVSLGKNPDDVDSSLEDSSASSDGE